MISAYRLLTTRGSRTRDRCQFQCSFDCVEFYDTFKSTSLILYRLQSSASIFVYFYFPSASSKEYLLPLIEFALPEIHLRGDLTKACGKLSEPVVVHYGRAPNQAIYFPASHFIIRLSSPNFKTTILHVTSRASFNPVPHLSIPSSVLVLLTAYFAAASLISIRLDSLEKPLLTYQSFHKATSPRNFAPPLDLKVTPKSNYWQTRFHAI